MGTGPIQTADITIHELTDETPAMLEELLGMFRTLFPQNDPYTAHIRNRARLARVGDPLLVPHQWLIEYNGELIGFRLFSYLRRRNVGFVRYVGIRPAYQRRGVLRALQPLTAAQLCADATADGHPTPLGWCGELEHPNAAFNEQERKIREQRVKAFQRAGAIVLDLEYAAPPQEIGLTQSCFPPTHRPEPLLFILTPIKRVPYLSPDWLATLVQGVLIDDYGLSADSWYVRRALASIAARRFESRRRTGS